jgi:hypothetical protein
MYSNKKKKDTTLNECKLVSSSTTVHTYMEVNSKHMQCRKITGLKIKFVKMDKFVLGKMEVEKRE